MSATLVPSDIYEDGDLVRIEYHHLDGTFEVQVMWDPEDEQTADNRQKLRAWGNKMVKQLGFEVAE